jgi:hypothetical protein
MLSTYTNCGDRERGVLGMNARRNGFASRGAVATIGAAALVLAALVAVIGSAQAAPSKKNYGATVDLAAAWTPPIAPATTNSATLRLTLSNDQKSNQTLGSANFVAPAGVAVTSVVLQPPPLPPDPPAATTSRPGWTATRTADGKVVQFRSTSNALTAGAGLYADVIVSVDATACGDATWTIYVKQSNDFSGAGNDFSPGTSVNARPLGSFEIAQIETVDPRDQTIQVPQILTNENEVVLVTAKDICGDVYTNYGTSLGSTAVFDAEPNDPPRLVDAGTLAIDWDDGIGSTTLNPKVVETGDTLVITDTLTALNQKVSDTSNTFHVVQELCTSLDDTCVLDNGKIRVFGDGPSENQNSNAPDPSLGFGFGSPTTLNFTCPGDGSPTPDAIGGAVVNINPLDYPNNEPIWITVIYKKSDTGNGPATSFLVCKSINNGQSWSQPLSECANTPVAPCVKRKRVTGGDLSVEYFIRPADPWTGLS